MTIAYEPSTDPEALENDPRDIKRLPPLGEAVNPDNWANVNSFLNLLANKAVTFYAPHCEQADINLQVLETGKSTPVKEKDVIANKIRQDMLTMLATMLRDAVTRTMTAQETNEPPELIQFVDRQTMSLGQFPLTDQVQAEFEQKITDWHWNKADLDADVWMALFNTRTAGWYIAPFEWDWQKGLPCLRTNISVRQLLLDPAAGPLKAVETANWAFLRWRVNYWQARARFPWLATHLAQKASDGSESTDPIIPLGRNEQSSVSGEKMVDIVFSWLRNYPVMPMTPEEALDYGEIEERPTPYQGTELPPPDQIQPVASPDAPDGNLGADQPQTVEPSSLEAQSVLDGPENHRSFADGANPTSGLSSASGSPDYFLPNGTKPITPKDPEWPWWLGIRIITRVQQCVAEDRLCNYYDLNLLHMPANPLPLSACGQGDPEAGQKIQEGHIRALSNAVEHSDLMAHPIMVYPRSAYEALPAEYKEKGASVAGLNVIVDDELYKALGGNLKMTEKAEPISASLGAILEILGSERQDITPAPNAISGRQTGDITGWQSTQMLQQQATSRFDLPAMFLKLFVKRLTYFTRHAVLWFVPLPRLQDICAEWPPEVVEEMVRRGRANPDRDVEIAVNLSSGGVQDRKKSEAVQQFGLVDDQPNSPTYGQRVLGIKGLRDAMGVDNQKEEAEQQAGLMAQQQMAQQQAQQAATMAKANPKAQPNGNGSTRFGGE